MPIEKYTEKTKKDTNKCKKTIDKIIQEIGNIITNPDDNLVANLDHIFEKSLRLIAQNDLENPTVQKDIFEQILSLLNRLFGEVKIKKLYNNIPKTDIQKYSKQSLGQQFIHNIYGKERKLFYKNEIEGGDCYYRTVLLKHLFDELKKRGMNIENRIFSRTGERGHSGLIVHFQGKDYFIDFNGDIGVRLLNDLIKGQESKNKGNNDMNQNSSKTNFKDLTRNNIKLYEKNYKQRNQQTNGSKNIEKNVRFFNNLNDFFRQVSENQGSYLSILFNPKLDGIDNTELNFNFEKPNKIILKEGLKSHTYFINTKGFETLKKVSNEEFIDGLIKHISAKQYSDFNNNIYLGKVSKEDKAKLENFFTLIRKKINISKLREFYGC